SSSASRSNSAASANNVGSTSINPPGCGMPGLAFTTRSKRSQCSGSSRRSNAASARNCFAVKQSLLASFRRSASSTAFGMAALTNSGSVLAIGEALRNAHQLLGIEIERAGHPLQFSLDLQVDGARSVQPEQAALAVHQHDSPVNGTELAACS